jgi:hypothetical protein
MVGRPEFAMVHCLKVRKVDAYVFNKLSRRAHHGLFLWDQFFVRNHVAGKSGNGGMISFFDFLTDLLQHPKAIFQEDNLLS